MIAVENTRDRAPASARKKSRLWLWFLAAFLVQAAAWTAWIVIASHHRVEEVPLAPRLTSMAGHG